MKTNNSLKGGEQHDEGGPKLEKNKFLSSRCLLLLKGKTKDRFIACLTFGKFK